MSVSLGSSTSQPSAEPPHPDEARSDVGLQASVYAALRVHLPELVTEWSVQWRALIDDRGGQVEDTGLASDAVTVLLDGLTAADEEPEAPITIGLRLGAEAFEQGASLYHTRKVLDLLVTMVMYAMETAAASSDTPVGSVTDGIRLAHQLERRAALLSLAATRGYTQAYGRALRDEFRHLRHDLRNPLGTIKSVLALMDDESVPLEARANPSFRAMAKRNARALEEMIAHRLSDDAAPLSPVAKREISLYTIAEAASRDLRREAERRGVTVLVDASELRGYFDSAGIELLLQGALLAALQESRTGEQLHLDIDEAVGRATVRLSCTSGLVPIANRDTLERLTTLASRIGASATFSERVLISVPMRSGVPEANLTMDHERPVMHDSVELGEAPHDLRSPREGDHGQASAL